MQSDGYHGLHLLQGAFAVPTTEARTRFVSPAVFHDTLLRGILWVTVSMALFAGLAAFARAAMNQGVPPLEVVFLRNLFATVALLPVMLMRGRSLFDTENLRLYGMRCVISTLSMMSWFYALSLIPIGELTAISFLSPLFGTLAAVLLLGEVVRARRWTALFIGFLGAMIILRPGGTAFGAGQLCAVLSALFGGFLAIMVKQLTAKDDTNRIVCLTNLLMTPLSLVPALLVWRWPTVDVLPVLLGMGFCAVLGHIALTKAFAALDASLVLTFEFSRLPFAVGIAYLAFGETIDVWTWLGALIIFGSAVYITRREQQLRKAKARAAAA